MKTTRIIEKRTSNVSRLAVFALLALSPGALLARHQAPAKTPRQAAQLGVNWLQTASLDWQKRNQCFGCHSQAQVIMGLSVAKKNNYSVNDRSLGELVAFTRKQEGPSGSFNNDVTITQYAAMAMAYYDDLRDQHDKKLVDSAKWLLTQQKPSGEIPLGHLEPPIDQGSLMSTANCAFAFLRAFDETGSERYAKAAVRAFAWIAKAKAETTQDQVFKILALSRSSNSQQKDLVPELVRRLKAEQSRDGGWKETSAVNGSNAFATGQVLYALKKAGEPIDSPQFTRGVQFLLSTQKPSGAWPSMNSQSGRPSDFAPTMWAVIGLAGTIVKAEPTQITEVAGGIRITMDNAVLFDFNRSDLKAEALSELGRIKASILDKHPDARLVVDGYTDDIGSDGYNLTLSKRRAQSVAAWIAQNGADASRIEAQGHGKENPRFPNTDDENRARNRRVEIMVLTDKGD